MGLRKILNGQNDRQRTRKKDDGKQKYLFLEFNAWLYQRYDDAKAALLQAVTKKLSDEMKKRKINESTEETDKKPWNRFKKFAKRVDWFKVSKGFKTHCTSFGWIGSGGYACWCTCDVIFLS